MPSTVSTKKVGKVPGKAPGKKKSSRRTGRPRIPGLADKIRCWHRYDQRTLDMLDEVRLAMLKDIPFLFHGHVDDSSIIAALICRAHAKIKDGSFKVSDYIIADHSPAG